MIKKLVLIALLLLSLYFPFSMVVAEAKDMNLYYILNTSNELKEKMNTNQLVYIYFFKDLTRIHLHFIFIKFYYVSFFIVNLYNNSHT